MVVASFVTALVTAGKDLLQTLATKKETSKLVSRGFKRLEPAKWKDTLLNLIQARVVNWLIVSLRTGCLVTLATFPKDW